MTTQGYGCFLGFCMWADGATLDDPACDWDGFLCKGPAIIDPSETKEVTMDFRQALLEAGNTGGCCKNDPGCGCMIRGTATFTNTVDYAKLYMEFTCTNLLGPNFDCSIP